MNNEQIPFRLLHTMLRVRDLDKSLHFYMEILGMRLLRREDDDVNKFTLAFLGYSDEKNASVIELTYNWGNHEYDHGTAYGHIALEVVDIYSICEALKGKGVGLIRAPGPVSFDQNQIIAFIEDPDKYKIELIQSTSS